MTSLGVILPRVTAYNFSVLHFDISDSEISVCVVCVSALLLMFSIFCSSQRFNILQESLIKLVEACNDQSHNMDRWLSKLEASNWLTHVKEILTAGCLAAQCIDR